MEESYGKQELDKAMAGGLMCSSWVMDLHNSAHRQMGWAHAGTHILGIVTWFDMEMSPESSTGVTAQRMHVYYVILRETKDEGLVQFYFSEERVQRLI